MKEKVSWPVALGIVAVLLVLLFAMYRHSGLGGSGARVSPGFQQLSPAEQQEALAAAARARMRRGAPPPGR